MVSRGIGLILILFVALSSSAQTLGLGLRHQRERHERDGFEFVLETTLAEAEVGAPPVSVGRMELDPFLRVGAGRIGTDVTFAIGDRRFDVFSGTETIGMAGAGVIVDPCDGCGWLARAEYEHQQTFEGSTLELIRRELAVSVERLLFDERVTASLGARHIDLDAAMRETAGAAIAIDGKRVEPFGGITFNVGRNTQVGVAVGLYQWKPELRFAIRYTFGIASPGPPQPPQPPGRPVLDGVTVRNGMLAFESQAAFDRTLDSVTSRAAAEELERTLSHASLRAELTQRQQRLEESDQLTEYNAPDNHFIQDRALRTLLNRRGEVQIGASVYVVADSDLTIEIPAAQPALVERSRNGAAAWELVQAGAVLHPSDTSSQKSACAANFTVTSQGNGVFSFANASQGTAPLQYHWDFGDGASSSASNPTHTFPKDGQYYVCMTVYDASGCSSTECRWVQAQTCYSHFLTSVKDTTVQFTAGATTSGYAKEWDFGDGTKSTEDNPTHKYALVGDYYVCLTITSAAGCKDKYCEFVRIKQPVDDCCDANDRVADKWTYYDGGKRRFKSVIWQRNLPFYHRWGARTLTYEQKSNGNWRSANADRVGVNGGGTIFFRRETDGARCANPQATNDYEYLKDADEAEISIPAGSKFWTKRRSLGSLHSVIENGVEVTQTLYLSQDCAVKICKENCTEEAATCKDVCTQEAAQCKDVCTAARQTCSKSCSGGWLKKVFCKLSCRWEAGSCKRECRQGKRTCKRTCTKAKRECRRECK